MNMLTRTWRLWATAVAVAVAVTPWGDALAQAPKPMAIISVASIDKLFQDIAYVSTAAGQPQARGLVEFGAAQFLEGIDRTRPIGAVVTMKEGDQEPDFLAFVPVTDFDAVVTKVEQSAGIEREDAGNGIIKLTVNQDLYLKEQAGWALVANRAAALANVPQDPTPLLAGLSDKYSIGAQIHVQSIPKALRDKFIEQVKEGFEASQGGEQDELAQQVGEMNIKNMIKSVEETEQIEFGWAIDGPGKRTYIDFTMTAREGTTFAKQMAGLLNSKSSFTGFLMDDAALRFNGAMELDADSIQQATTLIKDFRKKVSEQLDEDLDDPKLSAGVKEVVGELFDAVQQTWEGGRGDVGATLVLNSSALSFAGGSLVADGNKIDAAFRKLVDIAKNQPDFPEVKLNAGEHAGIKFHTVRAPVADAEAQKVLGQTVEVVVGTGAKAAYLAFGKDGMSLLKQAIDKSAANGNRSVLPMQMTIKLTPIIKFAASLNPDDDTLKRLVKSLTEIKGNDEVLITEGAVERGALVRIQIQEGVLRLIGNAAAQAGPPQF